MQQHSGDLEGESGGKDRNRTDFKRSSNARYNHISYLSLNWQGA